MTIYVIFNVISCSPPAYAQNLHNDEYTLPQSITSPEVTFHMDHEIPETLGYVDYFNLITSAQTEESYTFSTEKGDGVVKLTRTHNIMCEDGCPDTIEVYDVPEGYIAYPQSAEVDEGSGLKIKIFQYLGG